jgi:DNA polymerase-3 subunit delta'
LFAAGSHPDLVLVIPEEDKQQISIDQVRAATERLTKTSYRQGYKVAIVDPAHMMTPNAANSVLKTLEEPSARSLLILITSQPSLLLPTVRSRCQKITIARPSREQAIEWLSAKSGNAIPAALLEFAGGAPLRALAYADGRFDALNEHMQKTLGALLAGQADVTQVAAEWEKDALNERLTWLDLWLSSLARGALAGNADLITFPGRSTHLPSPSGPLNISGVYGMVDRARALRSQLSRTALQRELAVESWLIALLEVLEPNRKRA